MSSKIEFMPCKHWTIGIEILEEGKSSHIDTYDAKYVSSSYRSEECTEEILSFNWELSTIQQHLDKNKSERRHQL